MSLHTNHEVTRPRTQTRSWVRPLRGLVVGTLIALLCAAAPQKKQIDEYAGKAAFIARFIKYIEWPAEVGKGKPFVIAVIGEDPFGKKLEQAFKDKKYRKYKESPVVLKRAKTIGDLAGAHIVFVASKPAEQIPHVLASIPAKSSTLVIGESTGFAQKGGVLNFYLEDKRIRFEINQQAAKRRKLSISSKLLRVARIVKDK